MHMVINGNLNKLDVSTTRDECNEVEWRLTPLEGYDNLYIRDENIVRTHIICGNNDNENYIEFGMYYTTNR